MDTRFARLELKQTQRLRLLDVVYELTDGNPDAATDMQGAFARADLRFTEGNAALQYLRREGLLAGKAALRIGITHSGVKEREAVLRSHGATETEHFSLSAVQQVVNVSSAIEGAADADEDPKPPNVKSLPGPKAHDLVAFLGQLRQQAAALPPADRDVALEHVSKLEEQASSDAMNLVRVRFNLKGLEMFGPLVPYVTAVFNVLATIGA